MEILNKVTLGTNCRRRALDAIKLIVVHRCGVGKDAQEVANWYAANPQYTGGKMPYHFFIHKDGTVEQAVQLSKIAPGAKGANKTAVQIACHGDFQIEDMGSEQAVALLTVCKDLCRYIGTVNILGHDEVPNGSEDPSKRCPGDNVDMNNIRKDVMWMFEPWCSEEIDGRAYERGYIL